METRLTVDGNEACARIAYRLSELIAIYPITPASPMGELADAWAATQQPNLFGQVPAVVEMQSEGGAAGAVHGALQAGTLATTFTASQGLLLMIPNMYKIAGELTPFVLHVAARSVATHALSIFCDHSDVMAARQTGFAILGSTSVQEAHDLSLIAHAATLETRLPFLHFFDGFRTSHEVSTIYPLTDETIGTMIDRNLIRQHRSRALTPDHPALRGTAQNPDVFFQSRERANALYDAAPAIVQKQMDRFAQLTGRSYQVYQYYGAADAEHVIVMMGSGATTARRASQLLNGEGRKTGVLVVRLYRPFDMQMFRDALPATVRSVAVLDRTKEPGATGEPLLLDVMAALFGQRSCSVIGGRYGLSSKEFTPAMAASVFDELQHPTKERFTVGIEDDVNHTSLAVTADHLKYNVEDDGFRAVFFGLGADGTVSANKNSIKIIGEETDQFGQGHFVYDSKKSGSVTVSHLRTGPTQASIDAPYLVQSADLVAVHQFGLLERLATIDNLHEGGILLLNAPYAPDELFAKLPVDLQRAAIAKRIRIYTIDALDVARSVGLGGRISTVMQAAFFELANAIPREQALEKMRYFIEKSYGKRGEAIVKKNFAAIEEAHRRLYQVPLPGAPIGSVPMRSPISGPAPDFVRNVTAEIIAGRGDGLPVSAFPLDGSYPTGTTKYEKRDIALEIPIWEPDLCIQCGKCSFVCPHAVIRIKTHDGASAPAGFRMMPLKGAEAGSMYTIQVSPEDCTGCSLCVEVCPARDKSHTARKALNMHAAADTIEKEKELYRHFDALPWPDRLSVDRIHTVKGSQFLEPLFEFSGACAGCGETPYIKLVTQLFGDRMLVANATGCSSIYGGNLPTTPWAHRADGRGPAWSNSLFEDNAEFGLGMRLAVDQLRERAIQLLKNESSTVGDDLVMALLNNAQHDEADIYEQRQLVETLKTRIAADSELYDLADYLVRKSLWIIGGDGWGYDIGYGGLDHVLASNANVNILLLDTEVYSNTGGQRSKATPLGAVAKFAAAGKETGKKDLALQALQYGHVYVARVAFGANDAQTIRAVIDAERYNGPSLIIAYSHCIAHGYDLKDGLTQQRLAVRSGHWPLLRYHPDLRETAEPALVLDSKDPDVPLEDYIYNETRYSLLRMMDPKRAATLLTSAKHTIQRSFLHYKEIADESAKEAAARAQGEKA
jgi:pyruvate-ferredoxin/flavodoxin oxidoreductase